MPERRAHHRPPRDDELPDADAVEAVWVRWIVAAAERRGWTVLVKPHKVNVGGQWVTAGPGAGFPDLVLLRGHQLVFLEAKRTKGWRYKPGQAETLAALQQVTVVEAFMVRPVDADEVLHLLGPAG